MVKINRAVYSLRRTVVVYTYCVVPLRKELVDRSMTQHRGLLILKFSQVAELVDAPMNKGGNSQPEAMFSVRYHNYGFESCPDCLMLVG